MYYYADTGWQPASDQIRRSQADSRHWGQPPPLWLLPAGSIISLLLIFTPLRLWHWWFRWFWYFHCIIFIAGFDYFHYDIFTLRCWYITLFRYFHWLIIFFDYYVSFSPYFRAIIFTLADSILPLLSFRILFDIDYILLFIIIDYTLIFSIIADSRISISLIAAI